MEINADFAKRVVINTSKMEWMPSPMAGVERRMLDRIGGEVARATSIVRYAPNSHFLPHVHDGGEELIVLDGVFQDEHGDYLAGSYIRNPPTTQHTPRSDEGCVIFVKLWQFDPDDRHQMKLDMNALTFSPIHAREGAVQAILFEDATETVLLEEWDEGTSTELAMIGGCELLVLNGEITESGDKLSRYDWLRIPAGGKLQATAGPDGAKLWIKTRHLQNNKVPT